MFEMFAGFLQAHAPWSVLCIAAAVMIVWGANLMAKQHMARKLEAEFSEFLDDEPFAAIGEN